MTILFPSSTACPTQATAASMSRRRKGSGTLCPGERKAFACSRLENPRRARTIPTGRGMFMPSASVSATFHESGSTHMCDEFTDYYPYILIPQIEITEPYSAVNHCSAHGAHLHRFRSADMRKRLRRPERTIPHINHEPKTSAATKPGIPHTD